MNIVYSGVVAANVDGTGSPTVSSGRVEAEYDSTALVIDLGGAGPAAAVHDIYIECSESSGTFSIKYLPLGQSTFITPDGDDIDLSETGRGRRLTAAGIEKIQITPGSVAGTTEYTATVIGTAG